MNSNEVMEKVEKRQKNISTNEDLSDYGYVKRGHRKDGVQKWMIKGEQNNWSKEIWCKGGRYYNHHLEYNRTGLRGERNRVRDKHAALYRLFKQIIAPESQIHHEWIPGTADYRGVALVEKDKHLHGIIDPIVILDGKITLLTEAEVRGGVK